ncbi:hypothetical protein ASPFODRAFT_619574 [Aspergillus luchuensis CBS 106.47]|uniref:Uncharacterized protein n=1 Tax=Aspergillus luchuensis (strain CBS 106.47) TaxID=1137211 RepID=A0A1M3SYI4_ASPLC|nr:hypothetical protein ASPFODRAFT_619574 [Aspergillus luchuensis CBS 106.47]
MECLGPPWSFQLGKFLSSGSRLAKPRMHATVQYGHVECPSCREVCLWSRPARVLSPSRVDWRWLPRPQLDRMRNAAAADGECDS